MASQSTKISDRILRAINRELPLPRVKVRGRRQIDRPRVRLNPRCNSSIHTIVTALAYFLIGLAFVLGLGVALFLVRQTKAQMSDHFKSLSLDVLQSNSKTFVQLAKGELQTIRSLRRGI